MVTQNRQLASAAANRALLLLETLPADQRETLALQVLAEQLRSVVAEDVTGVFARLDILDKNPALTATLRRVLVWSRLRLIDRAMGYEGLRKFVAGPAVARHDPVVEQELYAFLRELDVSGRSPELAGLCELWLPELTRQPQLRRQIWLLQIKSLGAMGHTAEALTAVHAMLEVFPDAGDAWLQLADLSAAAGDGFSAERALARISAAEPDGSDRWLQVSMRRLQLMNSMESGVHRGCALAGAIAVYRHRLSTNQQQTLADYADRNHCAAHGES